MACRTGGGRTPYKIMCWIPLEPEDPEVYRTRKEAEEDIRELRFLQPDNIYKIVPASKGKEGKGGKPVIGG
jgi:hypothetical protein